MAVIRRPNGAAVVVVICERYRYAGGHACARPGAGRRRLAPGRAAPPGRALAGDDGARPGSAGHRLPGDHVARRGDQDRVAGLDGRLPRAAHAQRVLVGASVHQDDAVVAVVLAVDYLPGGLARRARLAVMRLEGDLLRPDEDHG